MQHILKFLQKLLPAKSTGTPQRGAVLIGAIAAMVIIGAIGAGILSVSKTSSLNEIEATRRSNAAYVARSGFNYAREQIRRGETPDSLDGTTISLGGQQNFTLSVNKVDGSESEYTVTSVATLSPGEKSYITRAEYSGVVVEPSDIVDSDDGDFMDMRFTGDNARLEDGNLTMGKLGKDDNAQNGQNQSGAAWYNGYDAGARHGKTPFNYGLRTYFAFTFDPQSTGDGFVFVARSATGDATTLDIGGDPEMGSLMGYGGPGPDDRGVPAPKFGLEFDIYNNSGTGDICRPGSRNDQLFGSSSQTFYDHMAYVFWGEHPTRCSSNKPLIWTYDDNRHEAGTEGSSIYPQNPISDSGYYYDSSATNWLKRGTKYYCREEIHRSLKPNSDGTYTYVLKTWITDTPPTADYKDVRKDYKADSPATVLNHTITLDETRHNALDKIYFGFTYGTGQETELVTVDDFKLAIRQEEPGPVLDDYVGYWPFDNFTYNPYTQRYESTPDVSGNGNDLSLSGGAVPGSAHIGSTLCTYYPAYWGPYQYYKFGYALDETPNNALSLTDSGTVMVWVSLADNTGGTLVRKLDTQKNNTYSTKYSYSLDTDHAHWGNTSTVSFTVANKGRTATASISNVLLVPAPYTLVAGTWDRSEGRVDLYVMSQRAVGFSMHSSARLNFSARAGDGELFVGENPTHGQFHGNLDELYIYNRALTEEEIKTYYHKYYPTP